MTVSYPPESFFNLIFKRWRASILKLVWKMLLAYIIFYYILYITYRFILPDESAIKDGFKFFVLYCREKALPLFPIMFVLGFFVSLIVGRWWTQAVLLIEKCKPDDFLRVLTTAYLNSNSEQVVTIRRCLARWMTLLEVLAWRNLSVKIRKRFPTESHLMQMGLMNEEEQSMLNSVIGAQDGCDREREIWMLPGVWCVNLLKKCTQQKLLETRQLKQLLGMFEDFMDAYRKLQHFGWMSVPMPYTQVAVLASHTYFVVLVIANQPVTKTDVDPIVPVFMLLQLLFFMGWLSVAADLIDPYGEDDDDFEMNFLFERNMKQAYYITDHCQDNLSPGILDQIDSMMGTPQTLRKQTVIPHTAASIKIKEVIPTGSLVGFQLEEKEMAMVDTLWDLIKEKEAAFSGFSGLFGGQLDMKQLAAASAAAAAEAAETRAAAAAETEADTVIAAEVTATAENEDK